MSNPEDRVKHSRRFYDVETHVERRKKLIKAKSVYFDGHSTDKQPHRLYKCSGMNCGNSHCVMCGNPRKFLKEKTIQERSFEQLPIDLLGEDLDDEINELR
jgi:hypothetical protein